VELEDVYRENYPIVYGYLLSLCGDPYEAEELTAQTFFRAILDFRRYDGTCKPSTWLCAIGKHLFYNECKRKKRSQRFSEATPPPAADPQQLYIEKEEIHRLLHSAAGLDAPYREVLFLRLEGLSFREIGSVMEKSENWARVTYFRAKAKIREEMGDNDG